MLKYTSHQTIKSTRKIAIDLFYICDICKITNTDSVTIAAVKFTVT